MFSRVIGGGFRRFEKGRSSRAIRMLESGVAATVRASSSDPVPTIARPISQAATWDQVHEPAYAAWIHRFGEEPGANRKVWEWAWICQTLQLHFAGIADDTPTMVAGFGVGTEPIVGWMASEGHRVLATDLPVDDDNAGQWAVTNQLAADQADLDPRGLASPEQMAERVSFRSVDMRDIPADLGQFDALWSSCAIEHLGSLEAGFDFVRATLAHTRPGGISLHTTELNVSHEEHTVESGHTVVYRRSDLEAFFDELRDLGHEVEVTFNLGAAPEDFLVDTPPFGPIHLKMVVEGVVTTSFGFAVKVRG